MKISLAQMNNISSRIAFKANIKMRSFNINLKITLEKFKSIYLKISEL